MSRSYSLHRLAGTNLGSALPRLLDGPKNSISGVLECSLTPQEHVECQGHYQDCFNCAIDGSPEDSISRIACNGMPVEDMARLLAKLLSDYERLLWKATCNALTPRGKNELWKSVKSTFTNTQGINLVTNPDAIVEVIDDFPRLALVLTKSPRLMDAAMNSRWRAVADWWHQAGDGVPPREGEKL